MKNSWNQPCHVVIEVENKHCKVLAMMETKTDKQLNVTDIRGFRKGSIRHLVELNSDMAKKIPNTIIDTSKKGKKRSVSWIESEGCKVCNTIISKGAFLVSGRSVRGSIFLYSFIVPNHKAYKEIVSSLERNRIRVKVLRIGKFKSRTEILTEKQQRILWIALQTGFFAYPKKIGSIELSDRLGISSSTLTEIIRRGTRRLLEQHFSAR